MKISRRWRVAQHFELRWWKNYLKNKDVNEYLTWKRNYWNDLLKRIDPSVKPTGHQHILDAGCGPAGIFIALAPYQVTAIDPLLSIYEKNLAHFDPAMYPYVQFQTVALENFSEKESFDLVFCLNAINHVSDLQEAFQRLYDCTKKGGSLVVSIDAHNSSWIKRLFRLQPADILHPHQYDLAEYEQMLTQRGCTMLQTIVIKKEFLFNHYVLVARKN